jgi:hypothetical protein
MNAAIRHRQGPLAARSVSPALGIPRVRKGAWLCEKQNLPFPRPNDLPPFGAQPVDPTYHGFRSEAGSWRPSSLRGGASAMSCLGQQLPFNPAAGAAGVGPESVHWTGGVVSVSTQVGPRETEPSRPDRNANSVEWDRMQPVLFMMRGRWTYVQLGSPHGKYEHDCAP